MAIDCEECLEIEIAGCGSDEDIITELYTMFEEGEAPALYSYALGLDHAEDYYLGLESKDGSITYHALTTNADGAASFPPGLFGYALPGDRIRGRIYDTLYAPVTFTVGYTEYPCIVFAVTKVTAGE